MPLLCSPFGPPRAGMTASRVCALIMRLPRSDPWLHCGARHRRWSRRSLHLPPRRSSAAHRLRRSLRIRSFAERRDRWVSLGNQLFRLRALRQCARAVCGQGSYTPIRRCRLVRARYGADGGTSSPSRLRCSLPDGPIQQPSAVSSL